MRQDLLQRLLALREVREPVAVVTELATGLQCLVTATACHGGFGLTDGQRARVLAAIAADRSGVRTLAEDEVEAGVGAGAGAGAGADDAEDDESEYFVHVFAPRPRLMVIGAGAIAEALAPMATLAGFTVTIIDPRIGFLIPACFPGAATLDLWPAEGLSHLGLDSHSAVVTLSHDSKLDDSALVAALASPAFYVGALGSRRTHARRLERLAALGLDKRRLADIRAPVGLAINARTPAEIAVAILAELVAVRNSLKRHAE